MNKLWNRFSSTAKDMRPFLRTKTGSRLAILAIVDFVVLFLAPLVHGFVGTAVAACVASVFLVLVWRRYDKEHVMVPAIILCVPMLLDMVIYREISVVVGMLIAIIGMLTAAFSPLLGFYDRIADLINALLTAGAVCVVIVVLACVALVLVQISWWILCIIAFLIVVAIFMGVVFSTAAYTASDGRRQARRSREQKAESQKQRYSEYRPRRRDNTVYNLDEDDDKSADEPEDDFLAF